MENDGFFTLVNIKSILTSNLFFFIYKFLGRICYHVRYTHFHAIYARAYACLCVRTILLYIVDALKFRHLNAAGEKRHNNKARIFTQNYRQRTITLFFLSRYAKRTHILSD